MSQNQNTFADEMYSKICAEWAAAHFVLDLTKIDPRLMMICTNKIFFTFSFPVTLTFDLLIL